MMRPLTAKDIVSEVGPQTYAANEVTRIYASPAWDAGIRFSCVLLFLFTNAERLTRQVAICWRDPALPRVPQESQLSQP